MLADFAEVELEDGAGVGGGAVRCVAQLLWVVDVSERHVLRRRGEAGGVDAVGAIDVKATLRTIDAGEQRTVDEDMAGQQMDRARCVASRHLPVDLLDGGLVHAAGYLEVLEDFEAAERASVWHPGDCGDLGAFAATLDGDEAALLRRADVAAGVHVEQVREAADRFELPRAVVVAGNQHRFDAVANQLAQRIEE